MSTPGSGQKAPTSPATRRPRLRVHAALSYPRRTPHPRRRFRIRAAPSRFHLAVPCPRPGTCAGGSVSVPYPMLPPGRPAPAVRHRAEGPAHEAPRRRPRTCLREYPNRRHSVGRDPPPGLVGWFPDRLCGAGPDRTPPSEQELSA
ncbi:hypothetical protein GCM10010259_24250 [Streptomyces daghestanicus]|uniref:Uncharacterized protein n=1 Tax=Streptomyces daghestanicus TaxID=66885 RepID=A0ABQ3QA38_9ACTN|nr:hypothetical protein GCM10010259_24250 [Streptomyces daghestanicus]GHI34133.1 hypothetical protein Sdagh_58630 [Streptomyces daghestanicus]